jgi:rSAM/selenodomain-associated transferase 2
MDISIIIPVYNEAPVIAKLVTYLLAHKNNNAIEVIVVDAGSTDDTLAQASNAGAIAITSPNKGRAAQMNFGATKAQASVLYFVHADTFPPTTYAADILQAVQQGYQLGRYQTKFDRNSWLLQLNAFFTRFDWLVCSGGDQTLFITKQLFNSINGFDSSMLIMEEYDLVTRARKQGKYKIFAAKALVSARKYEQNTWLQVQRANYTIVKMYKQGATQQAMIQQYKKMLRF